jgi:hypothetical protein
MGEAGGNDVAFLNRVFGWSLEHLPLATCEAGGTATAADAAAWAASSAVAFPPFLASQGLNGLEVGLT